MLWIIRHLSVYLRILTPFYEAYFASVIPRCAATRDLTVLRVATVSQDGEIPHCVRNDISCWHYLLMGQ